MNSNTTIVTADAESVALLKRYREDSEPLVSQSCEVALNVLEHELEGKSLEVRC